MCGAEVQPPCHPPLTTLAKGNIGHLDGCLLTRGRNTLHPEGDDGSDRLQVSAGGVSGSVSRQ
jgi:hypothetical protein